MRGKRQQEAALEVDYQRRVGRGCHYAARVTAEIGQHLCNGHLLELRRQSSIGRWTDLRAKWERRIAEEERYTSP